MTHTALVVDDSMLIRHTVCRYLEEKGYNVESATNGVEALEMLGNVHPDLIITDVQMPKMDGRQLIDQLKSHGETAEIPVIILANKQSSQQSQVEHRANYVIYKDIDIREQLERGLQLVLHSDVRG